MHPGPPDAVASSARDGATIADAVLPGRLERLLSELREERVPALDGAPEGLGALVELSYALRPHVHEGRVPTYGAIVAPPSIVVGDQPSFRDGPNVTLIPVGGLDVRFARRFADGMATFAVRLPDGISHIACFGRDVSAEYDLVGLQTMLGGLVIQRHPGGQVRVFGPSGVVRWDGISWHHDPPLESWLLRLGAAADHLPIDAMRAVLRFAVHELGGRRIGSTLIWRPVDPTPPDGRVEPLVHNVPLLRLGRPGEAAAIAHALAQTDGAAVFDGDGGLRSIGLRLAPSSTAETSVRAMSGMRHTSALRYSFDDRDCVVIVVSDAGPVTIMHAGDVITKLDPLDETIG
ncbi:MAG: hypothetical protein HKN44_12855 [Ilumatobacter sp.]|nr:hypothetical protein [Ilumatobacter sp.]